ncbi:MAG: hypothetical protein ABFR95_09080, partial [Actinomycetota bacterium]
TDACLANRTLRHDDHMHISFSVEGAYLHTSYYEALGFEPIPIPEPPDPLLEDLLGIDVPSSENDQG